ncbi:MAG: hypothetical protein J6Q83_03265 [Clostridia bacterium]|nr:hypothetical protein [Clostridia bacterium]
MNKKLIAFIAICLVLCMIPSVGMIFFPTTESTENKAIAEAPKLIADDGKFNQLILQECGEYFADHVALRNQMIFADAKIQSGLFSESNVSGVIYGTNDWLYYSSTLDDYLGRAPMSERELFNLSHNISIIQEYLDQREISFVFTVPPNKNTLYDENMPYYYSTELDFEHNAIRLESYLAEQNVNYISLFDLFTQQDEILYLKRDSHWNMKGACMAYNSIMAALEKSHNDYSDVDPGLEKTANGDLNKMLYSFFGETEENYSYDLSQKYVYTNDVKGVEDGWIITENKEGSGTLLMFRDSFADTLIPFISNEFETAYYSKGQPNAMERYIEADKPDCVVIEKVERNISDYLDTPPILTPPTTDITDNVLIAKTESDVSVEPCMFDDNYYAISGSVDKTRIETNTEIVVCVNNVMYRAYQSGENSFSLYLKKAGFSDTADIQVYAVNGDNTVRVLSEVIDLK